MKTLCHIHANRPEVERDSGLLATHPLSRRLLCTYAHRLDHWRSSACLPHRAQRALRSPTSHSRLACLARLGGLLQLLLAGEGGGGGERDWCLCSNYNNKSRSHRPRPPYWTASGFRMLRCERAQQYCSPVGLCFCFFLSAPFKFGPSRMFFRDVHGHETDSLEG